MRHPNNRKSQNFEQSHSAGNCESVTRSDFLNIRSAVEYQKI